MSVPHVRHKHSPRSVALLYRACRVMCFCARFVLSQGPDDRRGQVKVVGVVVVAMALVIAGPDGQAVTMRAVS